MIKRLAVVVLLIASMSGYVLPSDMLHNVADSTANPISKSEENVVTEKTVSLHFSDVSSKGQTSVLPDISLDDVFDADLDEELRHAVEQTNTYRRNAGISELVWSNELAEGASIRAEEIKIQFSHTRPDGSVPTTVCPLAHGENLLRSNVPCLIDDVQVIDALYASDAHRRAMLNPIYDYVGMAYSYDEAGCLHFVQLFGY